jgi:hypothetical protein
MAGRIVEATITREILSCSIAPPSLARESLTSAKNVRIGQDGLVLVRLPKPAQAKPCVVRAEERAFGVILGETFSLQMHYAGLGFVCTYVVCTW